MEGLTDTHERTAILLAAALRRRRNILTLPSSAEGLRLHPRPHGERRTPPAGTKRRLRKAQLLSSGGRTDRKQPGVHRARQGTPRRIFRIGGVQTLKECDQLRRRSLLGTSVNEGKKKDRSL